MRSEPAASEWMRGLDMVHIKSLKLRGFKSVGATKTVTIDFNKGFSAIVGANGSGKSNILEAFSFVMGNGSAKSLRAGNMRSMIFSGNKKKGIAPARSAWVQLEFDNTDRGLPIDGDTITISRKVKLNGQGIYKINGETSTRTAIRDLINMAGLDSDSYNMVLQGNVYEVVNMTKVERRKLIEEIAGIAAYDDKKAQAERELEKVEANLAQVRLLMNEVSTQLDLLEKEKDDALAYQRISKQLDHSENAIKIVEIRDLEETITRSKERVEELGKQLETLEGDLQARLDTISDLQERHGKIRAELEAKQSKELRDLNEALDQVKQELADTRSHLKYLEQGKARNEKEIDRLGNSIGILERERQALEQEVKEGGASLKAHRKALQETEQARDAKIDDLASHDKQFQEKMARKAELQGTLSTAKESLAESRSELKLVNSKLASERSTLDGLERKLSGLDEKQSRLGGMLAGARKELQGSHGPGDDAGGMDSTASKNRSAPRSPSDIQRTIKQLESDLRVTKDMISTKTGKLIEIRSTIKASKHFGSNGLQKAIDGLMRAKENGEIPGIFDTVGNLGQVDARYAIAMEVAAGSRVNYMVVQDRDVATRCIRYLKQHKLGRLSFIPLDKIRYHEYEHGSERCIDGVHGRAVDLIDFEIAFLPAFEYIFGRTFIVEDLETAKRFAPRFRRITLEGDVVDGSNLMTGGTYRRRGNGTAFQNKNESLIPGLEQEISQLKDKEREIEREIKRCQASISDFYTTKIKLEQERGAIREKIAKIEAQLEEIAGSRQSVEVAIKETKHRIDELVDRKEALLEIVSARERDARGIANDIQDIDRDLANSPHARIKQEIDGLDGEIKEMEGKINTLQLSLAQKSTRLEEKVLASLEVSREKKIDLETAVREANGELAAKRRTLDEKTGHLASIKEAIDGKNAELKSLIDERDVVLKQMEEVKLASQRLEMEKEGLERNIAGTKRGVQGMERSLVEKRNALPEDLSVPAEFLNKDRAGLLGDIESCKKEIEQMGNVNMMAIEKYNENKERFDELTFRHELLIKERESILEFMETIERQKKTAFMQTFQNISRNFTYIFSRLSPGGEAQLELENLDDPFEGGVLIMARPAGKPLNEISLLSGGEKSLTSLSLIFAIQQHCPSPLYILDEIDAALDDANAGRVADLIKELSDRSQFIIVTHRDVTMTKVDQILGVSNVDGCTDVINLNLSQISQEMLEG
ncbi:chromosome segregation protein SMC [Candidatus Bathyarchaeota archaeon]|nr:chromosome segregation protein SMC [Candidatus Bathyarchaeota archaeon]